MRILFVAIACSPHTGRWMEQIGGLGWDIHLYHDSQERAHGELREVSVHSLLLPPVEMRGACRHSGLPWPWKRGSTRATQLLLKTRRYAPAERLRRLIDELQPDIVHSLEMQRCSYLTAAARRLMPAGKFPRWIYSSWGSDLYLFAQRDGHAARIREVLAGCDYLITDCRRDVGLAREMGFQGTALGVVPGGGGFELDAMRARRRPGLVSARRTINIKGRHDEELGGRALVALEAVRQCARELAGYEIVVHTATENVKREAELLGRTGGLSVRVLPSRPQEEMVRLMGESRIAIGLGISDGTPNVMLEAMIGGAFPIQSDTISTREWIDGKNGLLVPPEDVNAVAEAIKKAVADDELVDRAAELNAAIADQRLERGKIRAEVIEMYRRVMGASEGPVRMKAAAELVAPGTGVDRQA